MPTTIYYRPGAEGWGGTFGGRPAVCWNPAPQTGTTFGFTPAGFGFTVVGNADLPVRIEVAEDLMSGPWAFLSENQRDDSGVLRIDDPASISCPMRFCRISDIFFRDWRCGFNMVSYSGVTHGVSCAGDIWRVLKRLSRKVWSVSI